MTKLESPNTQEQGQSNVSQEHAGSESYHASKDTNETDPGSQEPSETYWNSL
jgi:hypothetical protein